MVHVTARGGRQTSEKLLHEVCGAPGFVVYTNPSLGPHGDIRALCQNHMPGDDYT